MESTDKKNVSLVNATTRHFYDKNENFSFSYPLRNVAPKRHATLLQVVGGFARIHFFTLEINLLPEWNA